MICGAKHPELPETTCGRALDIGHPSVTGDEGHALVPHDGPCGDWTVDFRARCERLARELAAAQARAEVTERLLRVEWGLRHGCPVVALYGDDGELQCSACALDFKRLPLDELREAVSAARLRRMADEGESPWKFCGMAALCNAAAPTGKCDRAPGHEGDHDYRPTSAREAEKGTP